MFILYIDNDFNNGKTFAEALKQLSASSQCFILENCKDAVVLMKNEEMVIPDFIFINLETSLKNGNACLINLKNLERYKDVSVIIFSAMITEKEQNEFKGFRIVMLDKPMSLDLMRLSLKGILNF